MPVEENGATRFFKVLLTTLNILFVQTMTTLHNDPPPPPDPQASSRIALKGLIGQALEQALEDVQQELHTATTADDHHVQITATTLQCVHECYGTSVASTNWQLAPRAVMKGRLDHYNRFQGQWRIVVDDQAEVAPRPQTNNKRKRGEHHKSLFEGTDTVKLDEKLQILVYNDL